MDKKYWEDFRSQYSVLAWESFALAAKLYEMGAEKAQKSDELGQLVRMLEAAPEAARRYLGLNGNVNKTTVLAAIFEEGSSLLLDYVRNGRC